MVIITEGLKMGNLWNQTIARAGEQAVSRYFEGQGFSVLERNWRWGRFGEIDLILTDRAGLFVFVEVKTRRKIGMAAGFPESGLETINWRKQQKIVTSARCYVVSRHLPPGHEMRFDVVLVEFEQQQDLLDGNLARLAITHVPSAFPR